jgi:hypothetical protein
MISVMYVCHLQWLMYVYSRYVLKWFVFNLTYSGFGHLPLCCVQTNVLPRWLLTSTLQYIPLHCKMSGYEWINGDSRKVPSFLVLVSYWQRHRGRVMKFMLYIFLQLILFCNIFINNVHLFISNSLMFVFPCWLLHYHHWGVLLFSFTAFKCCHCFLLLH